jgi:hypothetical protein
LATLVRKRAAPGVTNKGIAQTIPSFEVSNDVRPVDINRKKVNADNIIHMKTIIPKHWSNETRNKLQETQSSKDLRLHFAKPSKYQFKITFL